MCPAQSWVGASMGPDRTRLKGEGTAPHAPPSQGPQPTALTPERGRLPYYTPTAGPGLCRYRITRQNTPARKSTWHFSLEQHEGI